MKYDHKLTDGGKESTPNKKDAKRKAIWKPLKLATKYEKILDDINNANVGAVMQGQETLA
jgi:hypothetical protein